MTREKGYIHFSRLVKKGIFHAMLGGMQSTWTTAAALGMLLGLVLYGVSQVVIDAMARIAWLLTR